MAYTQTNSPSQVNTIALSVAMADELDKALVEGSVTGMLADGDRLKAQFMGNGIVVVKDIDMQALGDYDRDTGFAAGAITISHTPYQLTQDRSRTFQIDSQDADESGIGNIAGVVMKEFVRTKVVPEFDAYVLSKIVGIANTNNHVTNVTGTWPINTTLAQITTTINNVQTAAGYDEELVCFVDSGVFAALQTTTEISRSLDISDFKKGDINTKVFSYNGVQIHPVPAARMKSAYTFYDGKSSGQTNGGFVPASGAKDVKIIVLPKRAVNVVRKHEKTRIFAPDKNLTADAWKLDYRLYYDVLGKKSYKDTVYAVTNSAS